MNIKHTEGKGVGDNFFYSQVENGKNAVYVVVQNEDKKNVSNDDIVKITRLLSSAPELLEACKKTLSAIKGGYVDITEAAMLNDIINKAEGRA